MKLIICFIIPDKYPSLECLISTAKMSCCVKSHAGAGLNAALVWASAPIYILRWELLQFPVDWQRDETCGTGGLCPVLFISLQIAEQVSLEVQENRCIL